MNILILAFTLACAAAAPASEPEAPGLKRVVIEGYDDDAMEPFVSRDGRYLLFNNLNKPTVNTELHFAERVDDVNWKYRGKIEGTSTKELEGCPTLDRAGRLYFVSPRDYAKTFSTIYTGLFRDGRVTEVRLVDGISRKIPGLVNFDVEIDAAGDLMIFVDSRFKPGSGPQTADLTLARREADRFVRRMDSDAILKEVNTPALEFAPTIAGDGLTLYFTRFDATAAFKGPQIYRTARRALDAPFDKPARKEGLGDYVEGTALSPDERLLYFHRKDGERFHIHAVPTP